MIVENDGDDNAVLEDRLNTLTQPRLVIHSTLSSKSTRPPSKLLSKSICIDDDDDDDDDSNKRRQQQKHDNDDRYSIR